MAKRRPTRYLSKHRDRVTDARADLDEFRDFDSRARRSDQRAERTLIERELQARRQAQVTANRPKPPEYVTEILGLAPSDPLARAEQEREMEFSA